MTHKWRQPRTSEVRTDKQITLDKMAGWRDKSRSLRSTDWTRQTERLLSFSPVPRNRDELCVLERRRRSLSHFDYQQISGINLNKFYYLRHVARRMISKRPTHKRPNAQARQNLLEMNNY